MHFSATAVVVILTLIAAWLISSVLAIVNVCWLTVVDMSGRLKFAHFVFFAFYTISAFGLFTGWFGRVPSLDPAIPAIAVPVLVIAHFVLLRWTRKRIALNGIDETAE